MDRRTKIFYMHIPYMHMAGTKHGPSPRARGLLQTTVKDPRVLYIETALRMATLAGVTWGSGALPMVHYSILNLLLRGQNWVRGSGCVHSEAPPGEVLC